tara:strand:- start:98 stop:769 length:672 start_codon:yes stop_codon:yes gene_type:complete
MKKKHLFNSVTIFLSIISSFSIDRYIEYKNERVQLETLEINLLHELEQNYYSLLSLRSKIKSVISVSDSVTANWEVINSKQIKSFHQDNLYDINERIEFILSMSEEYDSKNLYFNSLINSGLILKIKREKLRNEIESVGSLLNSNYFSGNNLISNDILNWFKTKSEIEKSLDNDFIFDKYKDFELMRMLTLRRRNEIYKLTGVNGYIKFIETLIVEVKQEGIF